MIVVLGAHAERIREGARRPATFVHQSGLPARADQSMQCGLRAVPPDAEGVLFTLVDHPAVDAGHARCAARGRGMPAPLLRVPRYQGRSADIRSGSRRDLIAEFLALARERRRPRRGARARRRRPNSSTWTTPASWPISTMPRPIAA